MSNFVEIPCTKCHATGLVEYQYQRLEAMCDSCDKGFIRYAGNLMSLYAHNPNADVKCTTCKGSGLVDGPAYWCKEATCGTCDGRRYVSVKKAVGLSAADTTIEVICSHCDGKGVHNVSKMSVVPGTKIKCPKCGGIGWIDGTSRACPEVSCPQCKGTKFVLV